MKSKLIIAISIVILFLYCFSFPVLAKEQDSYATNTNLAALTPSHEAEVKTAFCEYLKRTNTICNGDPAIVSIYEYYGNIDGYELFDMIAQQPLPCTELTYWILPHVGVPVSGFLVAYYEGKIEDVSTLQNQGILTDWALLQLLVLRRIQSAPFEDVQLGIWYYDPVVWAYVTNVTQGVDETHFYPNQVCTRAQAVSFLYRTWRDSWDSSNYAFLSDTDISFADVCEDDYFCEAVQWAAQNGIVKGVSDSRFAPNEPVTREQIVTMLWRMHGCPAPKGEDLPFVDTVGRYSENAICWAAEQEIAQGLGEETFAPARLCNRAQIVTFLYRDQVSKQTAIK